jgi:polysaccharide biosynthesis/export protein
MAYIGRPGGGSETVRRSYILSLLFIGSLTVLAGCSGSGPQSWDIRAGQFDSESLPYALIQVTPKVAKVLAKAAPRLVSEFRDRRRPADIRFGIGDVLGVTIFEASSGGLFIPAEAGVRPGNFITLPNQAVDEGGNISVPYAGTVRARGRTKVELQNAIVDALKDRAIEPQVVVTVITQQTSLITILGEGTTTRIPAFAAGERILDTLARAGGAGGSGSSGGAGPGLWILLERGGRRALSPFGALLYESANNIWTHPGDTIYLYREPHTFLSFGALGGQRQYPFDAWRLSLAEAIAKAGGLNDSAADPKSVFLYRGETRETVEAMGVDTGQFKGPIIPVIYNLNLRDPAGYFLATTFEMRNKDVIYVSNSVSVETAKFRSYLSSVYGTVTDPMQAALTYYSLKNVAAGTGAVSIISGGGGTTVVNPPPPSP